MNEAVPPAVYRVEFNAEVCRWCRCCELACSLYHEGVCEPALSRVRVWVNTLEAEVKADLCKQCDNPECMRACPVEGAMTVDKATGARLIDERECISCGNCAEACPYNGNRAVIVFNRGSGTYVKCDLCGGKPQCVEICPHDALKYVKVGGV